MNTELTNTGATLGTVRMILQTEAAVMLGTLTLAYSQAGYDWVRFASLFLTPDLAMIGYLAGPKAGSRVYNLAHTYAAAALLAAFGQYATAITWAAHIAFDRMLGYGLKYPAGFGATHLAWRGPRPA